jgi:tRNA dimethylallyltransferase
MKTEFSTPLLAIVGPTASGKSSIAIALAQRFQAEVISVDSLQVYQHFDIGTGKASPEEWQGIPHHMLDVADPKEHFDAAHFRKACDQLIPTIDARGKRVILAGGTGLYLKALVHGLFDVPSDTNVRAALQAEQEEIGLPAMFERLQEVDPASAQKIGHNDAVRIIRALEVHRISGKPFSEWTQAHGHREQRYPCMILGINPDRKKLYERIDQRIDEMFRQGWTTEVEMLLQKGYDASLKPMQCIGYREINSMLNGAYDTEEAIRLIRKHTRAYARRQLTWFRKENVQWYTSKEELLCDPTLDQQCEDYFRDPDTLNHHVSSTNGDIS